MPKSKLAGGGCLIVIGTEGFGYDANTWTVPLLATHLRTQGVVISARTLRRRIRAARFRWKRPRYVYSERAEHVGAKKGALSDG